jgi:hypothetical protein
MLKKTKGRKWWMAILCYVLIAGVVPELIVVMFKHGQHDSENHGVNPFWSVIGLVSAVFVFFYFKRIENT